MRRLQSILFLIRGYAAFDNIDGTVRQERSILAFSDDQMADSCESYWKAMTKYSVLESVNNQLVKSEYLVCDGLAALSEFKPYQETNENLQIGKLLLTKLDLRSFPSSFRRLASDGSYTFADLFPEESKSDFNGVIYNAEDWVFSLSVVAVVDANNNSSQDWVVQIADESKTGNYRQYATLLIYDALDKEVLNAESYP